MLVDFGYAEAAASDLQMRNDVAELLCSTAVEVGAERAVNAAVAVLGAAEIGAALPRLQPLALRPQTRKAMAGRDGLLSELQERVQGAAGIEDVKYEELARVSPKTVVGFLVFAVALYALLPRLAEVSDIGETLKTAEWWWLIPLLLAQSVTYVGAGLGIEGSVPDPVKFFPAVKAQVAAAFVDVLAPASIGGMALNTRFLQKRGVDPGVAVAGIGLNVVAGFVAHVLLLAGFLLWVGTGSTSTTESQPIAFGSYVVIVALVLLGMAVFAGVALAIPPTRRLAQRKLLPLVHEARVGIVELARQPRKLVALLGGSALVTLGFLAALVCAVRAFGGDVPFPELGVAYLLASTVAIVAPTPGGLGAIEAALIAALSKLGMSADAAVSAVFLFRTGTFWGPVVPGWITFQLMQRRGDI
jgi:undecaprenyl-diphosphatase